MWFLMLIAALIAGFIHSRWRGYPRARCAETMLVWVLATYCGIAQLLLGSAMLIHQSPIVLPVEIDPAVMLWVGLLIVGAGATGTLSIFRRGDFLLAPVVSWSIFWGGATFAHLNFDSVHGHAGGLHAALWIFATHGLVAVVLVTLYVLSRRRPAA